MYYNRNGRYLKGVDNSDYLMHWKYIKKVRRPNGKWRYYYDRKQLKRDFYDWLGADEKEALEIANIQKAMAQVNWETANKAYYDADWKDKDKAYEKERYYFDRWGVATDRAEEAFKKYQSTPLYKINSFISKGKEFVDSLFGKKKG